MPLTFEQFVDPNGMVRLHHYGPQVHPSQLPFRTDPSRFVTHRSPWSEAEHKAEPSPKTFFYLRPEDKERYFEGRELYSALHPASKIYDMSGDPKKIISRLAKRPPFSMSKALAILRRLGYEGVHYNFEGYGPPIVAMFKPVDLLPGGKADDMPDSAFDPKEIAKGIKVESEHTSNPALQKEIAKDHQMEDPHYYEKLKKAKLARPQNILDDARSYHVKTGIPFDPQAKRIALDPNLSTKVAQVYQKLPHTPDHPKVAASYQALKKETLDQFNHLVSRGVHFEPWDKEGQPYANSQEMVNDARNNRHLWFFTGGSFPANHPLAEPTGTTLNGHPLTYNDMFRAVHDWFGHAVHGHQFGPKGELGAWAEHAAMFSPAARPALSAETHGQNSWVNFGPHRELPVTQRPYAEQKATLLPKGLWPKKLARKWGSYGYCPICNAPNLRKYDSGTVECPRGHRHPRSQVLDKPRKKKLARRDDIGRSRELHSLLTAIHEDRDHLGNERDQTPRLVTADFLDDYADPRAYIVRNHVSRGNVQGVITGSPGYQTSTPTSGFILPHSEDPNSPSIHHALSIHSLSLKVPNLRIFLGEARNNGALSPTNSGRSSHPVLVWAPQIKTAAGKRQVLFHAPVNPDQLHAFIDHLGRQYPVVAKRWRQYAETRWPRVKKLARQRAPGGGIIVNAQFFQGGKFLPRAFKRIRDAVRQRYKLSREDLPLHMEPVLRSVGFDPKQATLHVDQLKKLEDAHKVPDRLRLSNKVLTTDRGFIRPHTVPNEKIYALLDAIGKHRLSGHEIKKHLASPDVSDPAKLIHLINHLSQDAQTAITAAKASGGDSATNWYGAYVDAFDKGLTHIMTNGATKDPIWGSGSAPGNVLAKAILAITSGGTNPKQNTKATVAALKAGKKRAGNHPDLFSFIPSHNVDALEEWKQHVGPAADEPIGTTPQERAAWYTQHVLPIRKLTPGYKSTAGVIVNRPGHPSHGQLVAYQEQGRVIRTGVKAPKKHLLNIALPLVDDKGNLLPKGWSIRGTITANLLQAVQNVIEHHHQKEKDPTKALQQAAKWLLTEHPEEELLRVSGLNRIDRGYLQGAKKLPGAFILGPKFGPFFMNLNNRGQHLTADLWFSRTFNRYMGSLFSIVGGVKKPQEAPRKNERPLMFEAAKKAAQKSGLKSVAELQAVLWYYEQNYWRWFGADTKSYSYLDGINEALAQHHAETGNAPEPLEIHNGKPRWAAPKDSLFSR